MSDKKLTILGVVAVIAVAAAIVVNQASKPRQGSNLVIGPLVGGLDVDQIAKITISGQKGAQKTTLLRNEGRFVVVEKDNYPAGVKKVNELVSQCLDIRTAELRTEDPAFHKDLGVTEDSAKSVITLWDAEKERAIAEEKKRIVQKERAETEARIIKLARTAVNSDYYWGQLRALRQKWYNQDHAQDYSDAKDRAKAMTEAYKAELRADQARNSADIRERTMKRIEEHRRIKANSTSDETRKAAQREIDALMDTL